MTNLKAWDYAVGMIKVDGLEPTKEFKEYIEKEKRGEVTMADIKLFLDTSGLHDSFYNIYYFIDDAFFGRNIDINDFKPRDIIVNVLGAEDKNINVVILLHESGRCNTDPLKSALVKHRHHEHQVLFGIIH